MPDVRFSEALRSALNGRGTLKLEDFETAGDLFDRVFALYPSIAEHGRPFTDLNVYADGRLLTTAEAQLSDVAVVGILLKAEDEPREQQLSVAAERGDADAAMALGTLYVGRGDEERAAEHFEQGGLLGKPRGWREAAKLYERSGQTDAAYEAYDRAIRAGDDVSVRSLAQMLSRLGREQEAVARLESLVSRRDPIAMRELGQLLDRLGDPRGEQLLRTAGFDLEDNPSLIALADVLWRSGDLEGARSALQLAAQRGDRRAPKRLREMGPPARSPSPAADPPTRPNVVARLSSDLPSEIDEIGVTPLVAGLAQLLSDTATSLPLAVAITGPWGSGKSSVMRQLQRALERPSVGERRWLTVRFDAWKYERRERLWAALATAIYRAPQEGRSWYRRAWFRCRLEQRRRGRLGLAKAVLWPIPVAALAVLTALAADAPESSVAGISLAAVAAMATTVTRYAGLIGDPFTRALQRHSSGPDYRGQLGFTEDAENDIDHLIKAAIAGDRLDAVAVFVDDLDRCSSDHVVEVVETMNQMFNSVDDRPTLFVLGMDRDVVAAAIEVAYSATVERLRTSNSRLAESFGLEFLGKLVQLSVSLPPPSSPAMHRLLNTLSPSTRVTSPGDDPGDEVESVAERLRAESSDLSDLGRASEQLRDEGLSDEEVAHAVAIVGRERIREDSEDVRAAEAAVVPCLRANPRQLKRFDNAFRLQLHVANESGTLDFGEDGLVGLARWVALRLRWPMLADDIDRDPELLTALESWANADTTDGAVPPAADGSTWHGNPELLAVLRTERVAARASSIPSEGFLRVM